MLPKPRRSSRKKETEEEILKVKWWKTQYYDAKVISKTSSCKYYFFFFGGGGGGGGSKTKQMNQPLKTEKIKNIFFMDNGHIWEGCSRLYRKKNVSHNKLPLIVVDTIL